MYFYNKFKVNFYDFYDLIVLKIVDLIRENHNYKCSKSESNYITFTKKKKCFDANLSSEQKQSYPSNGVIFNKIFKISNFNFSMLELFTTNFRGYLTIIKTTIVTETYAIFSIF